MPFLSPVAVVFRGTIADRQTIERNTVVQFDAERDTSIEALYTVLNGCTEDLTPSDSTVHLQMLDEIRRANRDTRAQYALMAVFGALCILAAFAPLQESIRITTVGTLFGFTAGLWVSHLLQVVQSAAEANRNGTDPTLDSR